MLTIFNLRLYVPFFSAILSILMIVYCLFKGRKIKLLYSYILLLTIIMIYSVTWGWDETVFRTQRYLQIRRVKLLFDFAEIYIGYIWLLFYGLYTESKLVSKKSNLWLLLLPPSLLLLSRLTNDYHQLYYLLPSYKPRIFHWFTIAVEYIYVSIGIMITIKYAIHQMKNSRSQSILLIFSAVILLVGNLLDQLQPIVDIKKGLISFTQFSLSLSVILLGVASFNYRFLNIIPVGRKKIINRMKESMMIINRANTVVNYNQSFKNNFPEFIQTKPGDLNTFTEQLNKRCDNALDSAPIFTAIQHGVTGDFNGELTLVTPEWKCFSVHVQSILSKRGKIQGRIVLFNDITHDKKLLRKLHDKNTNMLAMNQELAAANEQLQDYARTVEQLAISQERNRIARDLHDSLGHTMTALILLLENSTHLNEINPAETRVKLIEATGIAREGLQELRRYARHQTQIMDLLESLHQLIAHFEDSGIQIGLSVEGKINYFQSQYSETIYRICQEALTNAVRHGAAKYVAISLRFSSQAINLYIFDNGQGCQKITKGMGLSGMEQRVKELNGTIEYGSDGEIGFNIKVEIPVI